jgi:hypothetical protein
MIDRNRSGSNGITGRIMRHTTTFALLLAGVAYMAYPPYDLKTDLIEGFAQAACTDGPGHQSDGSRNCAENTRQAGTAAILPESGPYPAPHASGIVHSESVMAKASGWADLLRQDPGITVAEFCAADLDQTGLRCEARDWNETNANTLPTNSHRPLSMAEQVTSGRVIGPDGLGIGGVTVLAAAIRLYGSDAADADDISVRYRTMSDTAGFYTFRGLPNGDYVIRTNRFGPYRSARISVRAGVNYADLVLLEENTVVVQGTAISSEGYPLAGVTVLPLVLGVPSVSTDSDGHYQLPVALKPDVRGFAIRFQLPGFLEEYASIGHGRLDDTHNSPVDVVMEPVGHWTAVSGTVSSSDGSALSGRAVELRPVGQKRQYNAVSDDQGRFFFPAVEAPVDYSLHVAGGADHKDYRQQLHVTADAAEFDIVVEPYEFGEVSGRMINLDGSPVPDFHMVLRNTESSTVNAFVSSDADGNFALAEAPAGELVMASQSTPAILVRGVRLDPGDELHVPLILDWGEHEIRGLVVDRYGNPVPASRIVLKWFHQADGISSRATRRTAADAQGNFLFSQLGPGSHSLEVDAPGFHTATLDHDASRQGYELTVRLN